MCLYVCAAVLKREKDYRRLILHFTSLLSDSVCLRLPPVDREDDSIGGHGADRHRLAAAAAAAVARR